MKEVLYYTYVNSPVGKLQLIASDKGLSHLLFPRSHDKKRIAKLAKLTKDDKHPVLRKTCKQLEEYFAGKRKDFDLPLAAKGTIFQMKAWKALSQIPYGQTRSYGQQADVVGDRKKARAVGMANGRNPISIVVPCHRVIGADGSLTGFGGGLKTKKYLLDLEKKNVA